MAKTQTATITTTTGHVVTFVWSHAKQLYICQDCRGGVSSEAGCRAHAERAHAVDR